MSDKAQDKIRQAHGLQAIQALHDAEDPLVIPIEAYVRQLRREAIQSVVETQKLMLKMQEARHGK